MKHMETERQIWDATTPQKIRVYTKDKTKPSEVQNSPVYPERSLWVSQDVQERTFHTINGKQSPSEDDLKDTQGKSSVDPKFRTNKALSCENRT